VILADTSAWIEFQRATGSPVDRRLTRAIEGGEALTTTGTVIMELLAGARDDNHATELGRMLAGCRHIGARQVPLDLVAL